MSIHIQARGFALTPPLESHVIRRVDRDLACQRENIQRLEVGLSDINGPRGGADKCCHVRIALPRQRDVVVKDTHEDMYEAINRALRRAGNAVKRRLARRRVQAQGRGAGRLP